MAVEYELKTDVRGRKIAFKVDEGKKTRIGYKVAQNRQRGVRYRKKLKREGDEAAKYGLNILEVRKEARTEAPEAKATQREFRIYRIKDVVQTLVNRKIEEVRYKQQVKVQEERNFEMSGLEKSDVEKRALAIAKDAQTNPNMIIPKMRGKSEEQIYNWAVKRLTTYEKRFVSSKTFVVYYDSERAYADRKKDYNDRYKSPSYFSYMYFKPGGKDVFNNVRDTIISRVSSIRDEFLIDKNQSGICVRLLHIRLKDFSDPKPKVEFIDLITPYTAFQGCYRRS